MSILSNCRDPPAKVARQVDRLVSADRCDLPFEEAYYGSPGCPWSYSTCGYLGDVTPGVCNDGEGWWQGIDIFRGGRWTEPTTVASLNTQPWAPNPDIEMHSGNPRCYTMAHLFGFFNGVWNTRKDAEESVRQMERESFLGPKWREAPVRHELFYIQTCQRSDDDVCLQDVAEVFRQRSDELDGLLDWRWEYF